MTASTCMPWSNESTEDISTQLRELQNLQDGWLGEGSLAPTLDGLQRLADEFEHQFPNELPLPYIYPTPKGGICAEWTLRSHEISLEIDLKNLAAKWHWLDLEKDMSEEQELNLIESTGWQWIASRLQDLVGTR